MKFILRFFSLVCLLFSPVTMAHQAGASKTKIGIIFLGKSGAGKSTQIVAMHNLILGKRYQDSKEIIVPIRDADGISVPCNVKHCLHSESMEEGEHAQTQNCYHYRVSNEKYEVTLIDTPGVPDTRPERNNENIAAIVEELQKHSINAITFVVAGMDNRLLATLKTCIGEFKKMLTKESMNNFIIILSHTTQVSDAALKPLRTLGIPVVRGKNVFAFHHSSLFSWNRELSQDDRQEEERQWNRNLKTVRDLLDYAAKLPVYESEKVKELQKNRKNLEDKMSHQIKFLDDLEVHKQALLTYRNDIDEAKKAIELNENYILRVPSVEHKKIPLPPGMKDTVCKSCGKTCHHNCNLDGVHENMGDSALMNCMIADKKTGDCTQCHHSMGVHQHVTYRIKEVHGYREEVLEWKKLAKEKGEKWREELEEKTMGTNQEIRILEQDKVPQAYSEIARLYHQIDDLALGFTNNYFLDYLNEIEENLRTENLSTAEREQKLAYIRKARKEYTLTEKTIRDALNAEKAKKAKKDASREEL